MVVYADEGWQSSGMTITEGMLLQFKANGRWTDGKSLYTSGEGSNYNICINVINPADCVKVLPTTPGDALIGRIGDVVFPVGREISLSATQSGLLAFRMNDGDTSLDDNRGSLTVHIEWKQP